MYKSIFILFTLLCAITALQNVEELTDSTFDQTVLKSDDIWLVLFAAQWCGHCKHLKPEFQQLGSDIKRYGVRLGHVDAENNHKLVNQYVANPQTHMVSYPTVYGFYNGKAIKVPGNMRTAGMLLDWATDQFKLNNSAQEYSEDQTQEWQRNQGQDDSQSDEQEQIPTEL